MKPLRISGAMKVAAGDDDLRGGAQGRAAASARGRVKRRLADRPVSQPRATIVAATSSSPPRTSARRSSGSSFAPGRRERLARLAGVRDRGRRARALGPAAFPGVAAGRSLANLSHGLPLVLGGGDRASAARSPRSQPRGSSRGRRRRRRPVRSGARAGARRPAPDFSGGAGHAGHRGGDRRRGARAGRPARDRAGHPRRTHVVGRRCARRAAVRARSCLPGRAICGRASPSPRRSRMRR